MNLRISIFFFSAHCTKLPRPSFAQIIPCLASGSPFKLVCPLDALQSLGVPLLSDTTEESILCIFFLLFYWDISGNIVLLLGVYICFFVLLLFYLASGSGSMSAHAECPHLFFIAHGAPLCEGTRVYLDSVQVWIFREFSVVCNYN